MSPGASRHAVSRSQMTLGHWFKVSPAVLTARQRLSVPLFAGEKLESEVANRGVWLAASAPTIGRPFRVDGRRLGRDSENTWSKTGGISGGMGVGYARVGHIRCLVKRGI